MKYKLSKETMSWCGRTLHRIEALHDFGQVKAGERGGWIEFETNLSQMGGAWVSGDARVYDDARVSGDAWVSGNAWVSDNARVYGDAKVYGNVWVYGNAEVFGDANVSKQEDYIVFKNWWSSGRYFTWTRSNILKSIELSEQSERVSALEDTLRRIIDGNGDNR